MERKSNRNKRLYVRLTEEEHRILRDRALRYTDGNISRFIVQAIRGQLTIRLQRPKAPVIDTAVYDLLKEYRKIGANYNQVVRAVNERKGFLPEEALLVNALDDLAKKTDRLIEQTRQIKAIVEAEASKPEETDDIVFKEPARW